MTKISINKDTLFSDVFNTHYDRIVLFIYGYCKDWESARNIAQDCFITLWENIDKIDTEKTVLPYLFFIAKNKTLNFLKREIVKDKFMGYVQKRDTELRYAALESCTIDKVHAKEIEVIIASSIDSMSDKVRETFYLSRYKNLKNEDVAKELGISIKTVEYRISSALRVLRKNLKDFIHFF